MTIFTGHVSQNSTLQQSDAFLHAFLGGVFSGFLFLHEKPVTWQECKEKS